MSSRRDKQAELRRRMAEARSKLSLLADDESDREREGTSMSTPLVVEEAAIATSAASSPEQGELIPLVPPPRGGILRKPKYSNTSSFTDDSAPTPTPTATATATATCALQSTITETKGDHHEVGETNNSLGALMADYGDSSSDDDDDDDDDVDDDYNNSSEDAGGIVDDNALSSSSADNGYASRETQINPSASASASSFGENDTEATTPYVAKLRVTINDVEASSNIRSAKHHVDDTPPIQKETEKSSEISDEVWDEFNALLEEDDNVANEGSTSSMSEVAIAVTDVELPPPATTSTEKVKKKRKRESKRDMYDNEAAINFEQASYEARLARLMLLKSKKSQQRNNNVVAAANGGDDGTENALLLTPANEFYDPGLAFCEEEIDPKAEGGEEEYDGDGGDRSKSLTEKLKERKSVSEFEGSNSALTTTTTGASAGASDSQALKASISTFHTSLAKILRDRRDEARKLSYRGSGGGFGGKREPETNLLHEDEGALDGQWF